jgi:hypothetical protein
MANKPLSIKIPIKPHLKKFVLFMMQCSEPIFLDEKEMLGRAIIKILQEKRAHKFDNRLETYTDRIEVVLNSDMRERSPRLNRIIHINVELEKNFREGLILWIKAYKKLGAPANEACKSFLAELKIEETEYSYDAAYKVWQRFNQSSRVKNKRLSLESS